MNCQDYIVVIISDGYQTEIEFVEKRINNIPWVYITTTDGNQYLADSITTEFTFVLINQTKWNSEVLNSLFHELNVRGRKIIVWSHQNIVRTYPYITNNEVSKQFIPDLFIPFSHNVGAAGELFLKDTTFGNHNYNVEFTKIVTESLKKKSKSAILSTLILCQGYDVAQDSSAIPQNIKLKQPNKIFDPDWWAPVFRNKTNFEDTLIFSELNILGKNIADCPIKKLFDEYTNKKISFDIVSNALARLKECL